MNRKTKLRIAATSLSTVIVVALLFLVAVPALAASCFTDTGGHWAETYVCWLFTNGISSGYPDGSFRPDNSITRGEMAVMLQQVAGAGSAGPVANADLLDGLDSTDFAPANPTGLQYLSIVGNTFTPYSGTSTPYYRQGNGCVDQMPLNHAFTAPVHLPQGSQVESITLYSYDSISTTTISTAYFQLSDGQGLAGWNVSASSQPNTIGYQQNTSAQNNPATIDNQNNSYYVQWVKTGGLDSTNLSLCGVRVNYYLP